MNLPLETEGRRPEHDAAEGGVEDYLAHARAHVQSLIIEVIDDWLLETNSRHLQVFRDRMLDYPLREAKALRPAICMATALALGGTLEAAAPNAVVLELYHNAFLIHDDIEDGSSARRGRPALHQLHGIPAAVNAGDALLSLTLKPLLANTRFVGLGPTLEIIELVSDMCRQSVAGQITELEWIQSPELLVSDDEYVTMVSQKTGWYSFVAPLSMGAIVARAPAELRLLLERFGYHLAVAFQIRDDVLNLVGQGDLYGKEADGDLWEGKRTLMLLHALRTSASDVRAAMLEILSRKRPGLELEPASGVKTAQDVAFLRTQIGACGSIAHAETVASHHATIAEEQFRHLMPSFSPSPHRDFLEGLVCYVTGRAR